MTRANPYVGPRPFTTGDAELFFGRDREVSKLVALLFAHRVVLLYGPSGSGKTSFLQAGVLPRLMHGEEFDCLPVTRIRPGTRTSALAGNAYIPALLAGWEVSEDQTPAEFLARRERRRTADGFDAPRAVVIDQLEELLEAGSTSDADVDELFASLSNALGQDPLLHMVLSLRESCLGRLDQFASTPPVANAARMRLNPLTRAAAFEAITAPASSAGVQFDNDAAERLINDLSVVRVLDESGAVRLTMGNQVEPVQLQVVGHRLWSAASETQPVITAADVTGVDDALVRYCLDAIAAAAGAGSMLPSDLAAFLTASFITPGGTRSSVFSDVVGTSGVPSAALDELVNQHILRSEVRAGARWHELAHDRLIDPLRVANDRLAAPRKRMWRRRGSSR